MIITVIFGMENVLIGSGPLWQGVEIESLRRKNNR
jgi:hypothetical protein